MELFAHRCPWYVAGPLIGTAVVGLLWTTNRPLGALGGWIDLLRLTRRPRVGTHVAGFLLAGIVLGGLASSLAAGSWSLQGTYGSFDARYGTSLVGRAALLAASGFLIGFGASFAGGCTSGHGVCGNALGSRASFASTATFMLTAVVAVRVIDRILRAAP